MLNKCNQSLPLEFLYCENLQIHDFILVFRIFFTVDGFAIKFFFNAIADLVPDIIMFFNKSSTSIEKIHPLSFTVITFYVYARSWKNYTEWFNFIIIYITNKAFIIFSLKEILLDISMLSISTSFKKLNFYSDETYLFRFQYHQTL